MKGWLGPSASSLFNLACYSSSSYCSECKSQDSSPPWRLMPPPPPPPPPLSLCSPATPPTLSVEPSPLYSFQLGELDTFTQSPSHPHTVLGQASRRAHTGIMTLLEDNLHTVSSSNTLLHFSHNLTSRQNWSEVTHDEDSLRNFFFVFHQQLIWLFLNIRDC